jgi:vancomycin resistance protein YoaR
MEERPVQERQSIGWVTSLGLVGIVFVAVLIMADLVFGSMVAGRMYPGTRAAGVDLSWMTRPEASARLEARAHDYRLAVTVGDKHFPATAEDLGAIFDSTSTVNAAYRVGRSGTLPSLGLLESLPGHTDIGYSYAIDRAVLKSYVDRVVTSVGQAPQDAGMVVTNGVVSVQPDKPGRSVSGDRLTKLVEGSMQDAAPVALYVKPEPQEADVVATHTEKAVTTTNRLTSTNITLTYTSDGKDRTFHPTPTQIGSLLAFRKVGATGDYTLEPYVDTSKLKDYVNSLANSIDVSPVNKMITTKNGVVTVDHEGVDGLALDRQPPTDALLSALRTDAQSDQPAPVNIVLTTHAVPFKTINNQLVTLEIGSYVEINLTTQRLWVFQDHNVIYESPVTTGATKYGLGTVTGLFSIYYKTTNTHLVGYQYGYNYDVPVKYWMPFYQGFGMHDAVWRHGQFGGPDYYWNGSHGCVNMPDETAAFIYIWSVVGTPVWVHN